MGKKISNPYIITHKRNMMDDNNTINITIEFPISKERYKMYSYILDDFCEGLTDIDVKSTDIWIHEE